MPFALYALVGRTSSGAPAPTVLSVNYDLCDVLGGGLNAITVIGTNFVSGAVCSIGGTTATSTTFVNSGELSVVPAARSAGANLSVVVTNPDTQFGTLTNAFEYWTPNSHVNIKQMHERPDYSVAGSNGSWSPRTGHALSHATLAPSASSGAPVFNGTTQFLAASVNLNAQLAAAVGTVAIVFNPTAAAARAANPYEDGLIVTNSGAGTFGMAAVSDAGVPKLTTHVFDGTAYRVASVNCSTGAWHSAISRYNSAGSGLELNVDGGSFTATAMTGNWSADAGVYEVGRGYLGTAFFNGSVRAIVILNAVADATFATKFHKWARQRHGVA